MAGEGSNDDPMTPPYDKAQAPETHSNRSSATRSPATSQAEDRGAADDDHDPRREEGQRPRPPNPPERGSPRVRRGGVPRQPQCYAGVGWLTRSVEPTERVAHLSPASGYATVRGPVAPAVALVGTRVCVRRRVVALVHRYAETPAVTPKANSSPTRHSLPAMFALDPEPASGPSPCRRDQSSPSSPRMSGTARDMALHTCAHLCSIECHINNRMDGS